MKHKGFTSSMGMPEIMRQAARMQKKVEEAREQMKTKEVEVSGADGKVRVLVTCGGQLKQLFLDEEFLKSEGLDMALAALAATVNAAFDQAGKLLDDQVKAATGGIKLPGM